MTLEQKVKAKKDDWIDLHTIAECSHYKDGKTEIYIEYPKCNCGSKFDIVMIRRLVKKVGYKITKIENIIASDFTIVMIGFHTDIPKNVWELSSKVYSKYIEDTYSDYHQDSDSDDEDSTTSSEEEEEEEEPTNLEA